MTQQTVFYLLFTTTILISSSFVSSTKLLYNGTADVESKTLIQTKSGPVSGLITVRSGINVSCYLGIPYAEPPLGERRFAEPSAVKSWKSMFNTKMSFYHVLKTELNVVFKTTCRMYLLFN